MDENTLDDICRMIKKMHIIINTICSGLWELLYMHYYIFWFSCLVVSESLPPHGLQHARLPCPSLSSGVCSNSCPFSQWCHPTISSVLPPSSIAFSLSQHQGLFQWIAFSHQVTKYWSFNFSISSSNEYSWLISFRIDWFDLHNVQGTLKSPLQNHSSQAWILQCSAFFMVQLSYPYMTTGKTIALTIQTFVGKVISLCFNMPSRFVRLLFQGTSVLISWLQSPSAVILEPKQIVFHCFHCFPIYFPWSDGTRCHDLSFLSVEGFFVLFVLF